jgi:hypothetical protein
MLYFSTNKFIILLQIVTVRFPVIYIFIQKYPERKKPYPSYFNKLKVLNHYCYMKGDFKIKDKNKIAEYKNPTDFKCNLINIQKIIEYLPHRKVFIKSK